MRRSRHLIKMEQSVGYAISPEVLCGDVISNVSKWANVDEVRIAIPTTVLKIDKKLCSMYY